LPLKTVLIKDSVSVLPGLAIGQTVQQSIQCFACGLPNIQPDNDIRFHFLKLTQMLSFKLLNGIDNEQQN
jgi:hypothetical protein